MTVIDKTGASDAEFQARVARFDAAPVPVEVVVETVARAICEADFDVDGCRWSWDDAGWLTREDYRRMARAAIAAMPASPATEELRRAMLDLADNLDYYASKTTGGTHASGLSDAATQLRAALAGHAEEEADRG